MDGYPSERSLPVVVQDNGLDARSNWRDLTFGTTSNSGNTADAADADHDGRSNFLEYCTQTDPLKPDLLPDDFVLKYDPLAQRLSARLFDYNLAPNVTLTAQHSTDLVNWNNITDSDFGFNYEFHGPLISGDFGRLTFTDTNTSP